MSCTPSAYVYLNISLKHRALALIAVVCGVGTRPAAHRNGTRPTAHRNGTRPTAHMNGTGTHHVHTTTRQRDSCVLTHTSCYGQIVRGKAGE